jgi:actin-like ATPase involved in cell morphogenesis
MVDEVHRLLAGVLDSVLLDGVDIFDFGIVMVGGGALLPGIDQAIHDRTGIRVIIPHRPKDCVCVGLGRMIHSTNGDFSEFIRYKVK